MIFVNDIKSKKMELSVKLSFLIPYEIVRKYENKWVKTMRKIKHKQENTVG